MPPGDGDDHDVHEPPRQLIGDFVRHGMDRLDVPARRTRGEGTQLVEARHRTAGRRPA
ncbi:MAG TPA: hypothetical protein VM933_06615 [Acidimicrobiales bacterium]|nr:hypothetical protein [Acidimicrobiales bacterium]